MAFYLFATRWRCVQCEREARGRAESCYCSIIAAHFSAHVGLAGWLATYGQSDMRTSLLAILWL